MNNINKVISFVLGLIVVIIILLVITGKFNILNFRNKLLTVSKGNTTTQPTPTATSKKTTPTPSRKYLAQNAQTTETLNQNSTGTLTTIPSTGTPTDILLFSVAALLIGVYLMKIDSTY